MKVFFIRHGSMAGDPHAHMMPPVEGCLSETGLLQVERLANTLSGRRFDRIFSSPLGRALQTAQALPRAAETAIEVCEWLIEWRPAHVLEGTNDANFEAMCRAAAALPPEQTWKTPAGEGALDMAARLVPGWVSLMQSLGVHPEGGGYRLEDPQDDRSIALVAHGGSLGHLLAFVLGVPIGPNPPVLFHETGTAVVSFRPQGPAWYPKLEIPPPCSA